MQQLQLKISSSETLKFSYEINDITLPYFASDVTVSDLRLIFSEKVWPLAYTFHRICIYLLDSESKRQKYQADSGLWSHFGQYLSFGPVIISLWL